LRSSEFIRGSTGPIVGAHQGHSAVYDHCLGVREARSIVDPNRHASGGQRLDATCASARRRLVGDYANIKPHALWPESTTQRCRNRPSGGRLRRGSLALRCRWRGRRMPRNPLRAQDRPRFLAMAALAATSAQAAPIAVPAKPVVVELSDAPSIELVRQGCGWGRHRGRWRDRWGYWHWGHCVPNW
jgi:hypothetical protein